MGQQPKTQLLCAHLNAQLTRTVSSTVAMKAFLLLAQAVSLVPVFCNPLPDSIESLEFLNEFGALEVIPPSELSRRQTQDTACRNTANTRQCWSDGFSITTDFDAKTLDTGRTVTYNLEITNSSALSPDGVNRRMMLINGQYRK